MNIQVANQCPVRTFFRRATIIALAVSGLALGAATPPAGAETNKPMTKIRLVSLNSMPGMFIWAAKELGYYKEEGLDVDSLNFYPNGPAEIASGYAYAWDAAYMGGPPAINAGAKFGLLIAGLLDWQKTNYGVFIRKDADAGDLTSYLRNKTALTITASNLQYFLDACLRHYKVDPESVKMINMTPANIFAAAEGGQGDIISDWAQFRGKLASSGKYKAICDNNAQVGIETFDAYVIHPKFAKAHPEAAAAFIRAVYRVNALVAKDPKAVLPLAQKYFAEVGSKLTADEIVPLLLQQSYPSLQESLDLIHSGKVNNALVQSARFLKSVGAMEEIPKIDFVTTQFIEAAMKADKK